MLLRTVLFLALAWHADAFAAPQNTVKNAVEANVLREWILVGDRYDSSAAVVEVENTKDDGGQCAVVTTRDVAPGEVLFRLGKNAIWSDAYRDRDLGPKLRDYALKTGPGFSTVALAGGLAAEKVRRFRSREGLGVAPESAGFTVPSEWGAFARWLWSSTPREEVDIDESLVDAVSQGVNLLVPLLDVAARRYWTADAADEPDTSVLEEEWTRKALLDDGAPRSWSRSELEAVATDSMGVVLQRTRSPPPLLLDGVVGSLIPSPFVDTKNEPPETWPTGEGLAFVPLIDDLWPETNLSDDPNAVIGSPPPNRHGGEDDCLWCIATRKINVGERVIAPNPWI